MMHKYYRLAIIYPGILVVVIQILYAIINYDPNYTSEWFIAGDLEVLGVIMVIINAIIIGLLALPINLNKHEEVRSNFLLSALTWFAVPMIRIGYLLFKMVVFLIFHSDGSFHEVFFAGLNSVPYFIGLVWSFILFRKSLRE